MVFSSPAFVFAFLPVTFLLYFLIPWRRGKNALLLLASLLFYSVGSVRHLPLLLGVCAVNYLAGLWFRRGRRWRGPVMVLTAILSIGTLAVFKYLDFFTSTLNAAAGLRLGLPGLALPIGISFFTFQALSYSIDVYRDPESGTDSFFEVLLYISFFPQLIAGPIVKYHDVAPQLRQRTVTAQDAAEGCRRFIAGLGKKLLLADVLAVAVDRIYAGSPADARLSLLAGVCYCLQIYFDFSGYSDMAIGMGRMFGFRFLENFDYPFRSSTISEFWRRWHISLSSWFKEYVYIPLGGSRRGLARTCGNLLLVFLLTGLWHGAAWTFVLWGLWNGMLCVLERLTPLKKLSGKWYGHLYASALIMVGFQLFRADSVRQGLTMIAALFTGWSFSREATLLLRELLNARCLFALGIGLLLAAGLHLPLWERLRRRPAFNGAAYAGALGLLCLCLLRLAAAGFNPFIYFRF